MRQAEKIKDLNIDGEVFAVAELSEEIQRLVDVFNDWNQEELEAQNKLAIIQSAKNDLSRRIILKFREEREAAEGVEEAPAAEAEAPAEGE